MTRMNSTAIPMCVYSREDIGINETDEAEITTHDLSFQRIKCKSKQTIRNKYEKDKNQIQQHINANIKRGTSKSRIDAFKQYDDRTKQRRIQMMKTQLYDTDVGYGDMLITTNKWGVGEENSIF